jgi:uncharacterized protein YbcI
MAWQRRLGDYTVGASSGTLVTSALRCTLREEAREADMTARSGDVPQPENSMERRVSDFVARLYLDEFGKGPLYSETSIRGGLVVTVLREVLTSAEKALYASGRGDSVLTTRMLWQHATDRRFREGVACVVGREVVVAISGFELEHDMASETFILAAPVA